MDSSFLVLVEDTAIVLQLVGVPVRESVAVCQELLMAPTKQNHGIYKPEPG